tara:strand:+ start:3393 stop:4139 length:747 start_codon:yes stop_codon:yes gene_type:complete
MKLLDNIDKHNNQISEINKSIDSLLLTEWAPLAALARWWVSRKLRKKVFGNEEEMEDNKENREKAKKLLKKRLDDEKLKAKDVDDIVDDVQNLTGSDENANEELRRIIEKVIESQEALVADMMGEGKKINNITVRFSEPVVFKLKRGKQEGKELRLEGTKSYDVFNVEKVGKKHKVYFLYKTRTQNWLKEYSIMFSMKLKSLEKGKKQDRVTIDIVYMNEVLAKNYNYKVVEEKPLTHRAMVEIKSSK